jgi:hypothetical protein
LSRLPESRVWSEPRPEKLELNIERTDGTLRCLGSLSGTQLVMISLQIENDYKEFK